MKRKVLILALVVGLIGGLLATAGVAAGSVSGSKLDLQANDTDGDRFVLIQDGTVTHTQTLTKQGACGITSSGPDTLVALDATAIPNNAAPGLKDHIFGVSAKGEGNGTPCSRIDGNASGRGEQLIIEFAGPTIGNWYADYAQFGIKLKFGATVTIQALLDGEPVEGVSDTVECNGGDCGSDSGNDRVKFVLDGNGELFNGVVISVDSPYDGSASLLDDPAADLDSYFTLAADTEAPTISLNGSNPLNLVVDDPYVDPGATVTDNFDGVSQIFGTPASIDTSVTGSHIVTYNATDSSGNSAVEVTRTVNVYDGILDCGDETGLVGGTEAMEGVFKRLDNWDESACDLKPYTLNESDDPEFPSVGSTILFDPEGGQNAAYSGIVSAPEKAGDNPTWIHACSMTRPEGSISTTCCGAWMPSSAATGTCPRPRFLPRPILTMIPWRRRPGASPPRPPSLWAGARSGRPGRFMGTTIPG